MGVIREEHNLLACTNCDAIVNLGTFCGAIWRKDSNEMKTCSACGYHLPFAHNCSVFQELTGYDYLKDGVRPYVPNHKCRKCGWRTSLSCSYWIASWCPPTSYGSYCKCSKCGYEGEFCDRQTWDEYECGNYEERNKWRMIWEPYYDFFWDVESYLQNRAESKDIAKVILDFVGSSESK